MIFFERCFILLSKSMYIFNFMYRIFSTYIYVYKTLGDTKYFFHKSCIHIYIIFLLNIYQEIEYNFITISCLISNEQLNYKERYQKISEEMINIILK